MPIHTLTLTKHYSVANHTEVFEFAKPHPFQFVPGQYGGFTLINPPLTDNKGATRRFSLVSSPLDDTLAFVTRIQTSAFKQSLMQLKAGDNIKFAGPTGNFILHDTETIPAVFIAGGVGIAPFFSMLKQAMQQQNSREMYLFYGNRSQKDAAFFDDLTQMARELPHFHFIPVLEEADNNWSGARGYITETLIREHIADFMTPIYYICGAPQMVTILQETILELGVPGPQVKVEDFPGY